MSHAVIVDLLRNALLLVLMMAGPMLIAAAVVGLIISVLQTVTQVQEQTISFVPKLLAVGAVFLLALPWMLQAMTKYTAELLRSLPSLMS